MKLAFFNIPVFYSNDAADDLNSFLASHRIHEVQQQFIDNGTNSCWAFTVSYGEPGNAGAVVGQPKNRIDYREILSDEDFTNFAQLRDLRKQISDDTGVPLYGIFSNAQLADMVRQRPESLAELSQIKKVGKSKVERFGEQFLKLLASLPAPLNETTSDPN